MLSRAPLVRGISLLVGALAAASALDAQQPRPGVAAVSGLGWRNIGPAVMGGRISDLAVVETDPSTFFAATASGGLWRTDNQGASWTPLFDDQPTASVGAVAVAPSDPNIVWAGTGEPDNRQSSAWGNG